MKLNLDEIIKKHLPEELILQLDGGEYVVAPLKILDIDRLERMGNINDPGARDVLASLFVGEAPRCIYAIGDESLDLDQAAANSERVMVVIGAIFAWANESTPKKRIDKINAMSRAKIAEYLAGAGPASSSN